MTGPAEAFKALGELMSAARREKGVGLDVMARDTKIRKVVLEALEEGRTADLPPEIFVVGFIRSYGGRLGVDPEPWVRRYEELRRRTEAASSPQPPQRTFPARAAWAVGGLAAAAAVTGTLWYLVASGRVHLWEPESPRPAPSAQAPAEIPAAQPPEASPPRGGASGAGQPAEEVPAPSNEAAVPQTPPAEAGAGAAGPEAPAGPVVPAAPAVETPPKRPPPVRAPKGDLVLACTEDCWVDLYAGETRLLHRLVGAGEILAFEGSSFTADIGNAGGVTLTFKGAKIPLPGRSGAVVKGLRIPAEPSGTGER